MASSAATLPADSDPWEVYVAILGQPGQDNFGMAMSYLERGRRQPGTLTSPWIFPGPQVKAYLYTDRPIYRPGDTVYFRGVVRQGYNGRYTLPDHEQLRADRDGRHRRAGCQL